MYLCPGIAIPQTVYRWYLQTTNRQTLVFRPRNSYPDIGNRRLCRRRRYSIIRQSRRRFLQLCVGSFVTSFPVAFVLSPAFIPWVAPWHFDPVYFNRCSGEHFAEKFRHCLHFLWNVERLRFPVFLFAGFRAGGFLCL